MTNILKSLKNLVYDLTWNKEYIQEEISGLELKQLEKLSKILQNKYEHSSKDKNAYFEDFKSQHIPYVKDIDEERKGSQYIAKTKTGQPILYARFPDDYKIEPTDARQYVNQYQT